MRPEDHDQRAGVMTRYLEGAWSRDFYPSKGEVTLALCEGSRGFPES